MPGSKLRRCWRWLRIATGGFLVVLALCYAWFNLIGLPNFLKNQLTASLHERGLDLEFSRMRLRPRRGFIVENVRAGGTNETDGMTFTAKEIQLRLDYGALFRRKLELNGIVLHKGEFALPATPTNTLTILNVETRLNFLPHDTWSLENLTAEFSGVKFQLAGEIIHARELKNWPLFAGRKKAGHGDRAAQLAHLAQTLEKIKFSGEPKFNLSINGDARAIHTFNVCLNVTAPAVQSPWFDANVIAVTAHLTAPDPAPTNADAAWGFWTNLQPFNLDWSAVAENVRTEKMSLRAARTRGGWNSPTLTISNLSAQLGGGTVSAGATLDVASRRATFTNDSNFDLQEIAGFLRPPFRERLTQMNWKLAPHLAIGGEIQLPPWTSQRFDWRTEIEPTAQLNGTLKLTDANVGQAKINLLSAHFGFSNLLATLSELRVEGGRTKLSISGWENELSRDFSAHISGLFDPDVIRSFLRASNAVRGFSHLEFGAPLALDIKANGNVTNLQTLSADGRLALTNAAIRHQTIDWLTTAVAYTNQFAYFSNPRLARGGGGQTFLADMIALDIAGQRLFITNGDANVDPMAVARAIGPRTATGAEPYHFLAIPHARVNGCIPLKQKNGDTVVDDADLFFEILEDTPFRWKKFETPRIHGLVWWNKNLLIVTNAVTECYTGTAQGWGSFDTKTEGEGTDFSFFVTGEKVDLEKMSLALWAKTNQLAGDLSGTIHVTSANSSDWRTWDGFGNARLQNGLLWDVPVVGLVSTALSTLTPGLEIGNSRATDGSGTFTMTNGIVYTDTLEVRSLMMRIQYIGTVTLDLELNARAKAQLLRNVPLLGWIVSAVLSPVGKAFECKVTGTLSKPKIEPVYVPKVFLAPLHPIQTMEEIFSGTNTNAPTKSE